MRWVSDEISDNTSLCDFRFWTGVGTIGRPLTRALSIWRLGRRKPLKMAQTLRCLCHFHSPPAPEPIPIGVDVSHHNFDRCHCQVDWERRRLKRSSLPTSRQRRATSSSIPLSATTGWVSASGRAPRRLPFSDADKILPRSSAFCRGCS